MLKMRFLVPLLGMMMLDLGTMEIGYADPPTNKKNAAANAADNAADADASAAENAAVFNGTMDGVNSRIVETVTAHKLATGEHINLFEVTGDRDNTFYSK